jgi:hypothetical protein
MKSPFRADAQCSNEESAMSAPTANLNVLLQSMEPLLNPGEFVFATVDASLSLDMGNVIACIREPEGLSVVLDAPQAIRLGLSAGVRFAWTTLSVHSDLQAVGLTAAFATALGDEGISCSVVAGHQHDHIFVPLDKAEAAMAALWALQQSVWAAHRAGR